MILLKKAIRSMLRHKRAYISCIILMAIGVWTYTVMNSALTEIDSGKELYYEEKRLADAFATVAQIPKSDLGRLEEIEGIDQVDGRLVQTGRVLLEEEVDYIVRLKMISTIPGENDLRLNAYDFEGNDLSKYNDILLGYDFYVAGDYIPGDSITMMVNQRTYDFNVTGSIYSPEYVYIVENPGELFSDTTRFNVAYVSEELMMSMLGMEGVYNDLAFMLEEGYVYDDVKDQLEYALKKYDLISLIPKDDMLSYVMMEEEIDGGQSMSTTIPMAFVGMAAVVLYLMMRRIIEQDRTQIGIMSAFGYGKWTILFHYITYGLFTGVTGAILGLGVAYVTIGPYMNIYLEYYKLPIEAVVNDYSYFYIGGFWSIVGGGIGAYFGARHLAKLKPADAMRPKPPAEVKGDITGKMPWLRHLLTSRGFMAVRNIERNKIRSGFVIIGIMFSFSMIVMTGTMTGLMDSMFFNQFTHVLKYDAEIVLTESMPYEQGIDAALSLEEVSYAEGIYKFPGELHKGHESYGTFIVGIKDGNYLYKLYDDDLHINYPLPKDGIVLTHNIAKNLDVSKGDYVYLDSPYLDEEVKVYVSDVVTQAVSATAFMDLEFLSDLMGQNLQVSSIIVNSRDTNAIRNEFLYSDSVQKVEDKAKTLEFYEELLGSYDVMFVVMQWIGAILAFTIIYNTAAISMSERSREYATLRVLGLTIKEVREIMSFEYWVLCFFGILAGIPFARFLNVSLINSIDIEAFSWPAAIPSDAYLLGVVGCMIAVAFSNMSTVRAIKRLSMVEVLKERE